EVGPRESRRPLGTRPFILGGGAALTLNPEPLANFFDAIVIGEAEEVLQEIADCFLSAREAGLDELSLKRELARFEGVYIPSFYRGEYREEGPLQRVEVLDHAPERVKRRFVKNIDRFPTTTVIQTPNTEFKSMYMTETGRGCEIGCKFCVAGYMYRPIRKRSEATLRASLQAGLESGDSIGFVGAAVSSHPKIADLAATVAAQGKRAALSSIMSQKVTPELASSLTESEYKTVALAPEAGDERLRFRIGKRVCDSQIVDGVRTLSASGIRNFKLYFMVGLPSESRVDVEAIVRLTEQARDAALAAAKQRPNFSVAPRLILSVNPFIPKAGTPFQRHPFLDFKELKARLQLVKDGIRTLSNVDMKHESPRESYFQTVLSRGDRRVG
ncbi:MAG: radical SAM protein, partial [Bdellovibrionales bacterium]|nr:radical SAM protein [Bdellovibrionales bacterium]